MKKRPLMFVCLFFLIIRSVMTGIGGGQVELPASSIFRENEGKEVIIQGQVYQKTNTSKTQLLYLKNSSYQKSKVIIYDQTFQNIELGKTVTVRGTAGVFDVSHNPGNFDQSQYYARQGISGMVFAEEILKVSGETDNLSEQLYQLKQFWKEMLKETMGEKNGAVMSAILLSEKKEMDAEMKELYQKNGIGHILAISGLHISFIGLGIYQLFRKTGCSYLISGILASVILVLYVMMIGLSVSVIRAVFMLGMRMGADVSGRVYDMATALALAGAVTILWEPLYLTDAGFLMSYGAILGILLVLPVVEVVFPTCKWNFIKGMYASISINVILLPVLLFFYFEFPAYSILLNLIVIPLMSFILGFGLVGSILFFICKPMGMILLKGSSLLLEVFELLCRGGSRLPGARVVTGQPFVWQIVCYYILLAVLLLLLCKYKKKRVAAVLVLLAAIFLTGHSTNGQLEATVIDVGQGDGILLRGPKNGTYLIDGGSSDVKEVGRYRIEPFLKSKGVGTLDYVFLSHGDTDHYSGVEEMIERQDVGVCIQNLVLPATYKQDEGLWKLAGKAAKQGIAIRVIEPGMKIQEGELNITCIQPAETFDGEIGNASSMVLEIAFGQFSMLCTGDVEERGEELLEEVLGKKSYTVLKAAHHGSKNSSRETFLEKVKPKITVISAGKDNRYGHPHKEALERFEAVGSKIYNTIESGAITIKSDGKSLWLRGFH